MSNIAWQLKVGLALAILAAGGLWLWSFYTDAYEAGETACNAKYEAANRERENQARENIIKTEKRYEELLRQARAHGSEELVGPGVTFAIDALPDAPHAGE